mmetsp:Transcript_19595/g.27203  ORF Transcript_19595/g.27203 Transcript_19595/m.27203 type:complete len:520 (+) Transcript_19595:113-1672(+)
MIYVARRRLVSNHVAAAARQTAVRLSQQPRTAMFAKSCSAILPSSTLNYHHHHPLNNNQYRLFASSALWTKIQNVVKTFLGLKGGSGDDTPREIQERKDLSMSLLALTHNRLRNEIPQTKQRDNHTSPLDEDLIDQAIHILEKHGLETQSIVGLRYELQCVIAPQICDLFENFQYVDDQLSTSRAKLQKNLLEDYQQTKDELDKLTSVTLKKNRPDPKLFLAQKLNAIERLSSYHGWDKGIDDLMNNITNGDDDKESLLDEFGYDSKKNEKDTVQAIRHHQTINMVRSKLIRDQVGYSVISLKSTIPNAGRGVFVDGYAKAGSLIAFYPGDVWPKEYLSGAISSAMQTYFQQDPNYQLSLRYDDVAIDSRRSPYTVLYHGDDEEDEDDNNNNSKYDLHNPWALGHIMNHPPSPDTIPNCRTVMLNFTEPMKLESSGLIHYVPNTYAKPPMILGAKALDRDVIVMHGMGLITARDVSYEELFVDYRLSGDAGGSDSSTSQPDWYHVVEPNEVAGRWWHKQ